MADNIARVFADAVAADPTRPLLTWYDDATGERTELSGATLANWVAKTANLLVDGCGLGAGDTAGGAAAAALADRRRPARLLDGRATVGRRRRRDVDVLFAAADRVDEARPGRPATGTPLALAPFALPLREVPPGFADYVVEVRGHGDHFTPRTPVGAAAAPTAGRC